KAPQGADRSDQVRARRFVNGIERVLRADTYTFRVYPATFHRNTGSSRPPTCTVTDTSPYAPCARWSHCHPPAAAATSPASTCGTRVARRGTAPRDAPG